jgi:hypothetical protein
MNLNGHRPTTDPVNAIPPPEPLALRRIREAQALAERLDRERKIERDGGPKASRW